MPRFDRTGPRGEGPLTGMGQWQCRGRAHFSTRFRGVGRGGLPWGGGHGNCFGGGRGAWWREFREESFSSRRSTREEELDYLNEYEQFLQDEIEFVRRRKERSTPATPNET